MKNKNRIWIYSLVSILVFYTLSTGCKKDDDNGYNNETIDTVIDVDGNVYKKITIGTQVWMVENLKTTHYADGTEIDLVESDSLWRALIYTDKAFCYYDNSSTNSNTYGALYTWSAAMNGSNGSDINPSGVQGVCPNGWHMPSDTEWKELEMYLGMSQEEADLSGWRGTDEGSKLKSTYGWFRNLNATNESGFTALPGGRRTAFAYFGRIDDGGYFWTTTEIDTYKVWDRNFQYADEEALRFVSDKTRGLSVRCLKN